MASVTRIYPPRDDLDREIARAKRIGRCADCGQPSAGTSRCAEHRAIHAARERKAYRKAHPRAAKSRLDDYVSTWSSGRKPRRCTVCGETGHDRRLCRARDLLSQPGCTHAPTPSSTTSDDSGHSPPTVETS